VYSVPYSEHSSHEELRSFVDFLQPVRIIPSVNNDRGERTRQMVDSLR
jgi:hypothetical protein